MKQFEYVCAYAKIPSLSILSSSSRIMKKRGNLLLKGNELR
jgi:hypothetical protein